MIRLLQLAKGIRQIGLRPVLICQDFTAADGPAMRAFWGRDLHFLPYRAGNLTWRVRRLARGLLDSKRMGHRWISKLQSTVRRQWHAREQRSFQIGLDDLYDENLSPFVEAISAQEKACAAVCLDVFLTRSFERLPSSVIRILDTNDLYAIGRSQWQGSENPLWIELALEDELRGYRRADLVWAIQHRDEESIRAAAPDLQVTTVGHPVDLTPPDLSLSLRSRNVLFVASRHKWNVQGLRWFASEVYPLVKDVLPEKNIQVAGDIADLLEPEMPFNFLGRVTDLSSIYKNARAVISPIRGGSGLKIKNIEPMGYGKAVVSTRSAATGLEAGEGRGFLVGEDAAGFAKALRRVLTDDALCESLMHGAFEFAKEWNQQVYSALQWSFVQTRTSTLQRVPLAAAPP